MPFRNVRMQLLRDADSFLNQYMAVESSHLRNCKYTDGTEGTCCYRKYFALCHVCADLIVGCRLQTVECDIARCNVSL